MVTSLGNPLRMETAVALVAEVLEDAAVDARKKMVPKEEEVLGDRTILLLTNLMVTPTFIILISRT